MGASDFDQHSSSTPSPDRVHEQPIAGSTLKYDGGGPSIADSTEQRLPPPSDDILSYLGETDADPLAKLVSLWWSRVNGASEPPDAFVAEYIRRLPGSQVWRLKARADPPKAATMRSLPPGTEFEGVADAREAEPPGPSDTVSTTWLAELMQGDEAAPRGRAELVLEVRDLRRRTEEAIAQGRGRTAVPRLVVATAAAVLQLAETEASRESVVDLLITGLQVQHPTARRLMARLGPEIRAFLEPEAGSSPGWLLTLINVADLAALDETLTFTLYHDFLARTPGMFERELSDADRRSAMRFTANAINNYVMRLAARMREHTPDRALAPEVISILRGPALTGAALAARQAGREVFEPMSYSTPDLIPLPDPAAAELLDRLGAISWLISDTEDLIAAHVAALSAVARTVKDSATERVAAAFFNAGVVLLRREEQQLGAVHTYTQSLLRVLLNALGLYWAQGREGAPLGPYVLSITLQSTNGGASSAVNLMGALAEVARSPSKPEGAARLLATAAPLAEALAPAVIHLPSADRVRLTSSMATVCSEAQVDQWTRAPFRPGAPQAATAGLLSVVAEQLGFDIDEGDPESLGMAVHLGFQRVAEIEGVDLVAGTNERLAAAFEALDDPFGQLRRHVEAWRAEPFAVTVGALSASEWTAEWTRSRGTHPEALLPLLRQLATAGSSPP